MVNISHMNPFKSFEWSVVISVQMLSCFVERYSVNLNWSLFIKKDTKNKFVYKTG